MVQARCISNLDQSGDCGDRKGEYDLEVKVAELGFPKGSAVKNPPAMWETQGIQVWSLGREDPLEEGMTTHSGILTWRIP